ncbi:hypothetical protein [Streptomyces phaeochromogenes]|uniref:hypothetical protein n=1 Tax=Streptomyces phaeochromogenes TaxID=1923 RepID=UPI002DDADEAD|nr:hypothetical protein [Streptomyces phaeochromogenes]WRZ30214.1 hypothetical protein OG931_21915 [Streptomyces phaeochromogenes]
MTFRQRAARRLQPLMWGCLLTWLGWCAVQSAYNRAPVAAAVFVAGSVLAVFGYVQGGVLEDTRADLKQARQKTGEAQARASAWAAASQHCPIVAEITLGWAALEAACCLTAWHTNGEQHDLTCCRTAPSDGEQEPTPRKDREA